MSHGVGEQHCDNGSNTAKGLPRKACRGTTSRAFDALSGRLADRRTGGGEVERGGGAVINQLRIYMLRQDKIHPQKGGSCTAFRAIGDQAEAVMESSAITRDSPCAKTPLLPGVLPHCYFEDGLGRQFINSFTVHDVPFCGCILFQKDKILIK